MGKWLKRIAIALGALVVVLFLAVYFGGRWAAIHYLNREWTAGEGRFRLYGPDFRWSLLLASDSAYYLAPGAEVRVKGMRVSADLFRSLLRFGPSARLVADSVFVRVSPGPDTVKPRPDSIPFPEFKIPLHASVRIKRVVVRDTAADSLAPLVRAWGLKARTRGGLRLALSIDSLRARATGSLVHRLRAGADWRGPDSLAVSAAWGSGRDSASIEARLAKANLLRFEAKAMARLASTRPYASALGLPADLPRGEGIAFDAGFGMSRALTARARLGLRAEGLPSDLPVGLPDQEVAFAFDFAERAGTWSLRAKGEGGTDIDARGGIDIAANARTADSLADPAWLARHAQVTLRGHARGLKATVGGRRLPADLEVEEARLSPEAVRAVAVTGDGSRLAVDLKRIAGAPAKAAPDARSPKAGAASGAAAFPSTRTPAAKPAGGADPVAAKGKAAGIKTGRRAAPSRTAAPGLPPWEGSFSLELSPRETWMLAFTDTNVAFGTARVEGGLRNGAIEAVLEARGLKAYGVLADTLWSRHRFAGGVYVLEPSRLRRDGAVWELSGRAETGKAGPPASLSISNAEFGSLEAAQKGPGKLEAHARGLVPERLPYRGLDSLLGKYHPRLTADFAWDRAAKTGSADVSLEGKYGKDAVAATLKAAWDAERLDVRELRAALSGNGVAAKARLLLHGRQFYELKGLVPADVEDALLRADRFDLAKALAAFSAQPPLRSGLLDGELGFSAGTGFRGDWRARNLAPSGEERAFAIREVSLSGRGDSVILRAATHSETEPLFRDSARVAVTGLLGEVQGLTARVRAGNDIFLAFDGGMKGFRDLQGRLSLSGGAVLPGASGALSDVRIVAEVSLPLKEGIKGLSLTSDTLRATYVVAGLDTQAIAATVRMRDRKVEVPRLTLTGRDGAELRGRLEFDPDSRRFAADLSGERLSAQFGGDKIQLRKLAAHVRADSNQMIVQAAIGSGSAEHAKAALRAAGDFSRVTAYYRAPLGARAGGPQGGSLPLIRLSATLDSSSVRYRMRSLENLMGMFRKRGQRKASNRRAKPMQVDINVETAGRGNSIETDVLRLSYVGNISMVGTYPYALLRGRLNSVTGGIGSKKQAYEIKGMEIKWLNAPLEEGELDLNAEKRLARNCDSASSGDSCSIRMNLTGPLADIKFAYDSDCRGGFGTGSADVTALLFSVRRGCYSPLATGGGEGLTYEQQALGLLDPLASTYLSQGLDWISGSWIQSAQVSGIGTFAQDRKGSPSDTSRETLGVEILSKEFWRVRFRAKSSYDLVNADQFNPWSYRVGVEWRPPLFRLVDDPVWKNRIKNRITLDASVFTDPSRSTQTDNADALRRRLGLNYVYDWWGHWWGKRNPASGGAAPDSARNAARNAAVPDTAR